MSGTGEVLAVDVAFDLAGSTLPADHAQPLLDAIRARLPWLAGDEPAIGIHPLRANATDYGVVLLAQRAKLVLRVPQPRLADTLALAGQRLDVAGSGLAVGAGHARPLRAATTLAAHAVSFGTPDAPAFEAAVADALAMLAVECDFISGRRRSTRVGPRTIVGFGLALHGVASADSLRLQALGLGEDRALGFGLLVPAKTISCPA